MISATALLEIEQLLTAFAYFADRGDGEALGELFLEEATLNVAGLNMMGPQEIAADCRRRFADPHRKTRHVWSNMRIESADESVIATSAIQ
ncbi:MAG: nuclear transport factor 2 family protein, partial [Bradyrhizobium sp.]